MKVQAPAAAHPALAEEEFDARHVLDVGCGTGSLAILLARNGRTVTGVDPAAASLDVAATKPGGTSITWLHGDATTLPALSADVVQLDLRCGVPVSEVRMCGGAGWTSRRSVGGAAREHRIAVRLALRA